MIELLLFIIAVVLLVISGRIGQVVKNTYVIGEDLKVCKKVIHGIKEKLPRDGPNK